MCNRITQAQQKLLEQKNNLSLAIEGKLEIMI